MLHNAAMPVSPLDRKRRFGFGTGMRGGGFIGPLDSYTANLALALLPFRGFGSYGGAYCRVRDAGDSDVEQDVVYDAAGEPVFPTLVGSGGIRWWYDQSGNARDVGSATASVQPFLVDAVVNGYPVCRLDGSDDVITAAWSGTAAARTLYAVVKKRSAATAANYRPAVMLNSSGTNTNAGLDCNASGNWMWLANEGFGASQVAGAVTNWTVVALKFTDASTAQGWGNNTANTAFDPRAEYANAGLCIGGTINAYADADVAAVLLYNAAHDDTTRQAIQTILAGRFGITLA